MKLSVGQRVVCSSSVCCVFQTIDGAREAGCAVSAEGGACLLCARSAWLAVGRGDDFADLAVVLGHHDRVRDRCLLFALAPP
jgi:hypothetical protein